MVPVQSESHSPWPLPSPALPRPHCCCLVGILVLVGVLAKVGMRLALGIPVEDAEEEEVVGGFPCWEEEGEGLGVVRVDLTELAWCLGDATPPVVGGDTFLPPADLLETGVELLGPLLAGFLLLLVWAWLDGLWLELGVVLRAWPAVLGGVRPLGGVLRVAEATLCLA